jgi:hypothetical protein
VQGTLEATAASKAFLDVMTTAYHDVTNSEPFLPFPESVLPALVALRKTHEIIAESQAHIASQDISLEKARKLLEVEEAKLKDQKVLRDALQARLETLRSDCDSRMEMTPEQVAKEKFEELQQQKKRYDKDRSKLLKALNQFIDEHLGPMLAAEELGGPVVGDMMEVDDEVFASGFNAHGKVKKSKERVDEDSRQRRIDDIWGVGADHEGPRRGKGRGNPQSKEAAAAAAEMRELMEELLNSLMESGGDSSAAYVTISRESAPARFLVRSKVAEFHPKDATRLRLEDFGREFDD